jgi:AraC family transcriptional regulator
MPEFVVQTLLQSPIITVKNTDCRGSHRHPSAEECTTTTQLVFPYRGVYVRHVGPDQTVADANRVVIFNSGEGYRVSHPIAGGDASLTVIVENERLRELAPAELMHNNPTVSFRPRNLRIDARTQALAAMLGNRLRANVAEPLEAETFALALVQRALGARTSRATGASAGRRKLVDRAKLVLASDPMRRWTLAEIAAEVRVSPVYLTQLFQQVEGLPLYRYQLRLRLSRALDLLAECHDLTRLSLDLDFSSHSHFSAAFRRVYGCSPSEFRQSALARLM